MGWKKLNDLLEKVKLLSTKGYNIFLGRMYFTGDDDFQKMFVYQSTSNKLELKNNDLCHWLEIKGAV